jgi:diguanylate cyclase (GGDEF)-like protein/PAS domain S-box-containing protein
MSIPKANTYGLCPNSMNGPETAPDLLSKLVATVPDVLYRINYRNGQYEYLSPALELMLGYSVKEALTNPRDFTMRVIHPDDRERINREVQDHLTKKTAEPLVVECRMIHANGRIVWIRDCMRFEWHEGDLLAANGIMSDITERKRLEEELRSMTLTDELTGLSNRRGFFTLAQQQLKIANRLNKGMMLFFMDFDSLKSINDSAGHQAGDRALVDTALVLKQTFRESDVIARYGGDEFIALTLEISEHSELILIERLGENLANFNTGQAAAYRLSLSLGFAHYDPLKPVSIEELLEKADRSMYDNKRNHNHG